MKRDLAAYPQKNSFLAKSTKSAKGRQVALYKISEKFYDAIH